MKPTAEQPKKEKTPTFVATIRLKFDAKQEKKLLILIDCARQLYNACLGEALKRLNQMQNSPSYKEARKLPKQTTEQKKIRTETFKELNGQYGFTDASIQSYGVKTKNNSKFIGVHLGVHVCQKIATRAFKAVQKKAFGKAKKVCFKPKGELLSFEGKNNETFIRYSNGYVLVGDDVTCKCLFDPKDKWMNHALKHRVKYVRLVAKEIKDKIRFYAQLMLEGTPLVKYERGKETGCTDVGPSTIAFVGDKTIGLQEFCEEIVPMQKEKRRLQRKLERQRRTNNPKNYDEKGRIKKGKLAWVISNRYKKTRSKIKDMERKIASTRKTLHGRDSNQLLRIFASIQTEKLSYKAFQRLFGKSVGRKAPSQFMKLLEKKLKRQGGTFREFPTQTSKCSQTCHCGAIKKKKLSERWHRCPCGVEAQRDIYSAFIGKHVNKSGKVNLKRAKEDWKQIEPLINVFMDEMKRKKKQGIKFLASMGI